MQAALEGHGLKRLFSVVLQRSGQPGLSELTGLCPDGALPIRRCGAGGSVQAQGWRGGGGTCSGAPSDSSRRSRRARKSRREAAARYQGRCAPPGSSHRTCEATSFGSASRRERSASLWARCQNNMSCLAWKYLQLSWQRWTLTQRFEPDRFYSSLRAVSDRFGFMPALQVGGTAAAKGSHLGGATTAGAWHARARGPPTAAPRDPVLPATRSGRRRRRRRASCCSATPAAGAPPAAVPSRAPAPPGRRRWLRGRSAAHLSPPPAAGTLSPWGLKTLIFGP